MSLKLAFLLAGATGALGLALGYLLRWLILSAQKGSMELQVKQTLLEAKDNAQKIVAEAEEEANKITTEAKAKIEEKESQLKKTEDRLINKDELLDKRQADIDKDADEVKRKIEEVKEIKERLAEAENEKKKELERVSRLNAEEAKEERRAELRAKAEKERELAQGALFYDSDGWLDEAARQARHDEFIARAEALEAEATNL